MQAEALSKADHGIVPVTMGADGDNEIRSAPVRLATPDLASRRQFDALVAPHLPALRTRAIQLCRSHYDAEDVVQDALVRAFLARSQVNDPTRIRAWLLTIMTNTFIDLTRKRRRRPDHLQLVDELPTPDPLEPSPWDDIDSDDLRRAIDELTEDVRETYRLFAVEGCDYAKISEVQHIVPATVGSRLFRARKQLRILLTNASATGKASP